MNVYLDNNATTKTAPEVLDEMLPFLHEHYGNPNSIHSFGTNIHTALNTAADQLYDNLHAQDQDDIILTSCATESINTVHMNAYQQWKLGNTNRNTIITSAVEHHAVKNSLIHLSKLGMNIITLPADQEGYVSLETLEEHMNTSVQLVSIMFVNNETGLIFPIKEMADLAHSYGAQFHTDGVQSIGKISVDLTDLGVDFFSFSGHKFHAPKGIGGLFIKKKTPFIPLLHGGDQMNGLRSGTLNVPGIIGIGKAIELATQHLVLVDTFTKSLRNKLEEQLLQLGNVHILGLNNQRTYNTTYAVFDNIDGDTLLWHLNKKNIAVSTGAACASENMHSTATEASHSQNKGIRFSLSRNTTEDEILYTIEILKKLLKNFSC